MDELAVSYPNGLSYEPCPVSPSDITHLSFNNLIEEDPGKRERATSFFTCSICDLVVNDPQECEACQTLSCKKCIEDWKDQNK